MVRRGRIPSPLRALIYGVEGVGKSTLAAASPNPIFFDIEGGSDHLDAVRYVWRENGNGHIPRSMADVYDAIQDLGRSDHDYKTLVIDTIDALEPLVWDSVCKAYSGKKGALNKNGKKIATIEEFGWGKGFNVAVDEWRRFCSMLDRLRAHRDMAIILLGHCHVRTYKNPIDDDYDRFYLRLHDKGAGMVKEWADVVGFCSFEEVADRLDGEHRARGVSTGRRLIHLTRTAAWDAKSRIALPDQVEIDLEHPWQPFAEALDLARAASPEYLRQLIEGELARLDDPDTRTRVETAVAGAGDDAGTLSKFLVRLKQMATATETETQEESTDE
jgi:hypothetical protein